MERKAKNLLKVLGLIDATYLDENATEKTVATFLKDIKSALQKPAAVCVLPSYVSLAHRLLGSETKIATVINFPRGEDPLAQVVAHIEIALREGADEIDLVYPQLMSDTESEQFIRTAKEACGNKILKVIIESGELPLALVGVRTEIALAAGADFIKTSTGRTPVGATFEAVTVILHQLKLYERAKRLVGIKISGGIKTIDDSLAYLSLIESQFGTEHLDPRWVRLGSSQLFNLILKELPLA